MPDRFIGVSGMHPSRGQNARRHGKAQCVNLPQVRLVQTEAVRGYRGGTKRGRLHRTKSNERTPLGQICPNFCGKLRHPLFQPGTD